MGGLVSKLRDYIWGPIEVPRIAETREHRERAIEKMVVDMPEGVPETLEAAKASLLEARMMGAANIFELNRERTALEALVSELRK